MKKRGLNKMAVLAVPINKPFEVDSQKTELFEVKLKTKNGKKDLQDRIKKIDRENIRWDLKK